MAKRVMVRYTSHWNGSRVAFTAATWEQESSRLVCRDCRTLAGLPMASVIRVDLADQPEVCRLPIAPTAPERTPSL